MTDRTCRTIGCPHDAMILSDLCLAHALQRDQAIREARARESQPDRPITAEQQARYDELRHDYTAEELAG